MSVSRRKKMVKYVLPTVIGQVAFFLFTIIDGIFIGNGVGTNALGALNLILPFVLFVNAFNMLITVGGVAVAAVRIGKNNIEGATDAFLHAFFCMAIVSAIMSAIGVLLPEQIGSILGANETYIGYVKDYLFWYSLFIIPSSLGVLFQFFGRTDGANILVMVATITSACLNIFLDWLFVFPLNKGVGGAAIATGISQTVSLIIVSMYFFKKNALFKFRKFKFQKKVFGKIFLRGIPETIAQFATPVATLFMNRVLLASLGEIAVNSYSVISYVASFSVAIFYGVATGIQPLLGEAYGDKNTEDLHYYRKWAAFIDVVGSVVVYVVVIFIISYICKLFATDDETAEYAAGVIAYFGWGFIVMSLNTLISTYLYSTKRTTQAIIVNVLRSFVFNTAATFLLPMFFGKTAVWFSFGVYEVLSFIVGMILMITSEKNGINYR